MPTLARDGAYDQIGGLKVGIPDIEFPFQKNGDMWSCVVTQQYKQTPGQWLTDRIAVTFLPGVATLAHANFGTLHLLAESIPAMTPTGLYSFARIWARIPRQQIVPTSLFVTKPDIASLVESSGNVADVTSLLSSGVNIGPAYDYSGYTFGGGYAYNQINGASTRTLPTGGTFTLTYIGSTTGALNWNDSDGTIATALNGLASVSGAGLVFSAGNALSTTGLLTLTVTTGSTQTPVTMNAASLTPSGASTAFTWLKPTQSVVYIAARVTLTAHGLATTDNLLVHLINPDFPLNAYLLLPPATATSPLWSAIDANTVAFAPLEGNLVSDVFGQADFSYAPGTVLTRAKRVTDFYLPGVSFGIGTMDDVPLPEFQGDAATLLAAILAGDTSINWEVGELAQWRESPILARTITTLNASTL